MIGAIFRAAFFGGIAFLLFRQDTERGLFWTGILLLVGFWPFLVWFVSASVALLRLLLPVSLFGLWLVKALAGIASAPLTMGVRSLVLEQFRLSPLGYALSCAGFAVAAYGFDWLGLRFPEHADGLIYPFYLSAGLSVWMGLLCVWGLVRKFVALITRFTPSRTHGDADFATPREVAANLSASGYGPESVLLSRDPPLNFGGASSLLTVAPQGSGKTTGLVIPNLVHLDRSIFATDPKGELAATTARYRRELCQTVHVINPWRKQMTMEMHGLDLGCSRFNPLSILKDSDNLRDNARLIAGALLPPGADGKDGYWRQAARSLLVCGMMWQWLLWREHGEPLTLPELYAFLCLDAGGLREAFEHMQRSTARSGAISQEGSKMLRILTDAPEQYAGIHDTALQAVAIFAADSPLGEYLSREDGPELDFRTLAENRETVFLVTPGDKQQDYQGWVDLVVNVAIKEVARSPGRERVLFMLDEFGNMGYLPEVLKALARDRGKGLQFWFVLQYLNQIQVTYGEQWRSIWAGCECKQFFSVTESELLREISELLGQRTVKTASVTGDGVTVGETGQRLLSMDQVRRLPKDEQLILIEDWKPILARKIDYRTDAALRRRVDPNPLYSDAPRWAPAPEILPEVPETGPLAETLPFHPPVLVQDQGEDLARALAPVPQVPQRVRAWLQVAFWGPMLLAFPDASPLLRLALLVPICGVITGLNALDGFWRLREHRRPGLWAAFWHDVADVLTHGGFMGRAAGFTAALIRAVIARKELPDWTEDVPPPPRRRRRSRSAIRARSGA
jgi:type IV secretion system protein VirD4